MCSCRISADISILQYASLMYGSDCLFRLYFVKGLTGEHNIYKRRGSEEPFPGKMQQYPKRLTFVVDVSGSMYRFNGHDQRLERMLQYSTNDRLWKRDVAQ